MSEPPSTIVAKLVAEICIRFPTELLDERELHLLILEWLLDENLKIVKNIPEKDWE